jgi:hypothetical protein
MEWERERLKDSRGELPEWYKSGQYLLGPLRRFPNHEHDRRMMISSNDAFLERCASGDSNRFNR